MGQYTDQIQQWAELLLIWVGFGTIAGLLAKAVIPGRDPGGALATMGMGIGGTIIGCGVLTYFYDGLKVTPISPVGFLCAIAGSCVILFFYKMLAGYWFVEGDEVTRRTARRRRGRRYNDALYD